MSNAYECDMNTLYKSVNKMVEGKQLWSAWYCHRNYCKHN